MTEEQLSDKAIISEINDLRMQVNDLGDGKSALLKIAQESFIIGSKSHLSSLNPEIREELGLELDFMTQQDPKLKSSYIVKKNKYLSLGKSYASISFLFDLIEIEFTILDFLLLQEILMDDGEYRKNNVFIQHPDGTKLEFGFESIPTQVDEVFDWYYKTSENEHISPIVIAVLFHYKIVSIHPFLDGNGRISRLILNLILLKNGLFPITIPNEKRKEYYESLIDADNGKIETLVDYFSVLVKDKLNQFLAIADELKDIGDTKELLVLTEDGNTDMISKIIEIHGLDLNKVQIESYDGKDNLASAIFFANKLINKSNNLKSILIHQDRDNDNPQQLKQIISKHLRSYGLDSVTTVLITKYYDIESYFLNERHVNAVFSNITIDRAKELIDQSTKENEETSKAKLRRALAEHGKFGKMTDPQQKVNEINALYDSDPINYRYGKDVLFRLEELITLELGLTEKVNLTEYSEHINISEFKKLKL
ncbi:MAG: Fic family protein [Roseivirga sp.]|uniref:Fic family protein n=1 Tax=Roseivirga sp. TaxID=1964215 RepID=UPI001AFCD8B4|nr:Fic family protein [Roseivirga sp.]MBO6662882.1 Fic family protein [Roseivirga sp.]MBO6909740.1 Fic family protein [Roseivirga sp.]